MRTRQDHLDVHGGDFANPTSGELIDRSAGGTLDPLQLRNGREIGITTVEGAMMLAGSGLAALGTAAGFLDYLDPLTYLFKTAPAK